MAIKHRITTPFLFLFMLILVIIYCLLLIILVWPSIFIGSLFWNENILLDMNDFMRKAIPDLPDIKINKK